VSEENIFLHFFGLRGGIFQAVQETTGHPGQRHGGCVNRVTDGPRKLSTAHSFRGEDENAGKILLLCRALRIDAHTRHTTVNTRFLSPVATVHLFGWLVVFV
jgi:hypothetical protein